MVASLYLKRLEPKAYGFLSQRIQGLGRIHTHTHTHKHKQKPNPLSQNRAVFNMAIYFKMLLFSAGIILKIPACIIYFPK